MNEFPQFAITFDIDWAPDWAIRSCVELLEFHEVPGTLFVTHSSPYIESLHDHALIELGIHPNFLPNSSHGNSIKEIVDYCTNLVPDAKSMRTHGLMQSTHILTYIIDNCPHITTDVSLFLPGHSNLQPTELYLGNSGRRLIRLPYFWEDDILAGMPNPNWSEPISIGNGLKIFDFHPTFVALNMATIGSYLQLKKDLDNTQLKSASKSDFAPHVNSGEGSQTYLRRVLALSPQHNFSLVSHISNSFLDTT